VVLGLGRDKVTGEQLARSSQVAGRVRARVKLKRSARTEDAKRGDAFVEAAALGNAARWSLGGDGRRHAWASSADGFGPGRRARTAQGTTAQQGRVGCAHVPGTARHLRGLI